MTTKTTNQRGLVALIIVIVIMTAAAAISTSVVFVFLNQVEATKNVARSYESFYAAESGIEDIVLRYLDSSKDLPGSYPSSISVGSANASTTFNEDFWGNATIISEGLSLDATRRVEVRARLTGQGIFSAAAQVGVDGIVMDSNSEIIGNAFSNGNITGDSNTQITGDAVAVGIISSPKPVVTGTKTQGADPVDLPYIDIDYWKSEANKNSDPIAGNLTYGGGSSALGPRKIQGNLTLNGNAELTMTGAIHVTGNFNMNSNSDLFIDEIFVASTTVMIIDGIIELNSNAGVHKTIGTPHGYLLLFTTSTSTQAIELNSNSIIDGALYAPDGTVTFNSNADIIAFGAKGVVLDSNAVVDYDLGLKLADFTGGPKTGPRIVSWSER